MRRFILAVFCKLSCEDLKSVSVPLFILHVSVCVEKLQLYNFITWSSKDIIFFIRTVGIDFKLYLKFRVPLAKAI